MYTISLYTVEDNCTVRRKNNIVCMFICAYCSYTEPNTGFILWVQQFYGLLVKRFLHSIRNWRAIITQIVLPVIFILLGLILIETVPGTTAEDKSRILNLPESALTDDNIVAFFAEFGDGPSIFQVGWYVR